MAYTLYMTQASPRTAIPGSKTRFRVKTHARERERVGFL